MNRAKRRSALVCLTKRAAKIVSRMRWVPCARRAALTMRHNAAKPSPPPRAGGRRRAAADDRRGGRATTTTAAVADHERGRRGRRGRGGVAAAAPAPSPACCSRRTTERSAPRPQSHFPPESLLRARAVDDLPVRAAQIISRRAPCRRHARGPGRPATSLFMHTAAKIKRHPCFRCPRKRWLQRRAPTWDRRGRTRPTRPGGREKTLRTRPRTALFASRAVKEGNSSRDEALSVRLPVGASGRRRARRTGRRTVTTPVQLPAPRKAHKGQPRCRPHNPQLKEQRGVRVPAPPSSRRGTASVV